MPLHIWRNLTIKENFASSNECNEAAITKNTQFVQINPYTQHSADHSNLYHSESHHCCWVISASTGMEREDRSEEFTGFLLFRSAVERQSSLQRAEEYY